MHPSITSLLLITLSTSTIITMSSYHWMFAWAGLEINMLSMLPLISKEHHPRAVEATMKYFMTQAAASAMLIFASTINAWQTAQWDISLLTPSTPMMMLTLAITMKLGLAPFHFWLPEVSLGTTNSVMLIITTWQKLAPLAIIILLHNSLNHHLLTSLGLLSMVVGGWGGMNQLQIRKIMAYSSIAHMGWVVMILPKAPDLSLLYLMLYIMLNLTMFLVIISTTLTKLTSLFSTQNKSFPMMILMALTLLSMGGLPPMTGFLPKWLILQELIYQHQTQMATLASLSTLLSLFFYLRLVFNAFLTTPPNTSNVTKNWRNQTNHYILLPQLMILSLMLLIITPLVISLF
uniref:NADH-ubiquinone oxidoreductase chain 2 n=1 Tax=Sphenodon punctatus TaxID=8508 RepID=A0A0F7LCX4_SPHPU|nr:NADH dehydrogenase subunit 2 [Sphenodon punctatus]